MDFRIDAEVLIKENRCAILASGKTMLGRVTPGSPRYSSRGV